MDENNKEYSYFSISDFLFLLWKHKILVILCIIVAMVAAFVKVQFFTEDVYRSQGVLCISSRDDSTISLSSMSITDIDSSRGMVPECIEILHLDSFLTAVSEDLDGKYTCNQLRNMISMTQRNETFLMNVTVSALNPEDAYAIANSVVTRAPQRIFDVLQERGKVSVADSPTLPQNPVGRGLVKWLAIGAIMGAVSSVAIVLLINFFDRKVHKASDIEKRYNVPILGELDY